VKRILQRSPQTLRLFAAAVVSLGPAAPALASLTLHPLESPATSQGWIARGGGRGGGRAGGRAGGGGGGGRIQQGRTPSGFGQAGAGFNRGNTTPSGGWSNRANIPGGRGPTLSGDRVQAGNRVQTGNRINDNRFNDNRFNDNRFNDNRFNDNRFSGNRVNVNRNWNRVTNIGSINVNPGWAHYGWGGARPWPANWYGGWRTPPWGWWAASSAVWGLTTLTTAAIINSAVNDAIADSSPVIIVPNTGYQLLYGTVQPVGANSVSFVVQANGSDYQLTADCNQGLINGQQPQSADQAQLLNAACQVAFGSA
jgi:hypothetical protein